MNSSKTAAAFDLTGLKGEPTAVLALAEGKKPKEAARLAGVSVRTIRRRREIPEYQMEVSRQRSKLLDAAVGRLVAGTTAAVETMIELMANAKSEHVRLGAAKAIVEYSLSLQEAIETQNRIETLEELYVQQRTVRFESWRTEVTTDAETVKVAD